MLFFEEPEYGKMVQFRYIKSGLLKRQHYLCLTFGDVEFLEDEMQGSGIDVEGFERKNLLHLHRAPNFMEDPEGSVKAAIKFWKTITADLTPPYRAIPPLIREKNTEAGMASQLNLERYFQTRFNGLVQGSIVCPYSVLEIEASRRSEWFEAILQNHHDAIFAPEIGWGIAFAMR